MLRQHISVVQAVSWTPWGMSQEWVSLCVDTCFQDHWMLELVVSVCDIFNARQSVALKLHTRVYPSLDYDESCAGVLYHFWLEICTSFALFYMIFTDSLCNVISVHHICTGFLNYLQPALSHSTWLIVCLDAYRFGTSRGESNIHMQSHCTARHSRCSWSLTLHALSKADQSSHVCCLFMHMLVIRNFYQDRQQGCSKTPCVKSKCVWTVTYLSTVLTDEVKWTADYHLMYVDVPQQQQH